MKICKNIIQWHEGLEIPLNELCEINKKIYKCILGNGGCYSKENIIICSLKNNCRYYNHELRMRCNKIERKDRNFVIFIETNT